jgi:protein-S-isoprenylcysteine O-methyltransferase Ste14
MTVAYVTRHPRRSGRRDAPAVLVALMVTLALFVAVLAPSTTSALANAIGIGLLVSGTLLSLVTLLHLRRSFSILPEARELVTTGPYALTRHPLYIAETLEMAGIVTPALASAPSRASLYALAIVPFALGQWVRARWEEAVLSAEFTSYAEYARRVRL